MPSRNRRRVRNYTLALLLLGVAAWIVPSYVSAEHYRRRLRAGLEQTLHRPVRFGAVSFRLLPHPGFSIANAEVGEDPRFGSEPFARVDRIDCDLRWRSIWRSRMDFTQLHLSNPTFNLVVNSRGEWNVQRLLVQSGVTAGKEMAAAEPHGAAPEPLDLAVDHARINFQVGADKIPFALTEVRAHLQIDPQAKRVTFQITASPVRSNLPFPTPGPVEANGVWTPGADLHGPLDARLRTRDALLYDWIAVVTGRNPQLYGVMDSDVHLTGSLADLGVSGETHVTQFHRWKELPPLDSMPLTVRFRGRLVRGRERAQVEGLEASFGDSLIHVSGAVENLSSDPQLDLVASLEHSRLEDLMAAAQRVWPRPNSWSLRGRIDAMLTVQGPWHDRRYGGFVGARQASLVTPTGAYALSEVAVRVNHHGALLAPFAIVLAPRINLTAQGTIAGTKVGSRYDLQLTAKGVPLHNALAFGRGIGVRGLQGLDATGAASATIHLGGDAWPPGRPPVVIGRADVRAVRLFIPGLTEPLNLPRVHVDITGDRITADPVVAVLGTSVFNARLVHQRTGPNPWHFDLRANSLILEQAALWFEALSRRPPLALIERLPGLSSFAAQRQAAAHILETLNAEGDFATPLLGYHGVKLRDFRGHFQITGRTLRMQDATFAAAGGHGAASGAADFTTAVPKVSASATLAGAFLQDLTAWLPGSVREVRGIVNATGNFQTSGLAHDELAQNLVGQVTWRVRNISLGDLDLLGNLAEQAHWGKLEPAAGRLTAGPATLTMQIRDRQFILRPATLELAGANLQYHGDYSWGGALNLSLRADLSHLHRRWLSRADDPQLPSRRVELVGPLDHLMVNPRVGVATVGGAAGGRK
jgi:hypothetical protein